jgi:hypothetical protein
MRFPSLISSPFFAVAIAAVHAPLHAEPTAAHLEFYEKKIRPILVNHCYSCHSADTKPAGGLRVDDHQGLLIGGDSGPATVPGDPQSSLLLQRLVHANDNRRMPQDSDPLTAEQIADLTTWVQNGVAWPAERIPSSIGKANPQFESLKKTHWAWQPLSKPSLPEVAEKSWPQSAIDHFVLSKLESKKLRPVADADRLTLIRRVTYDLTGLPPTLEQIDAFLSDTSPQAFAKVVDRLLASRAFGERWGRHWLDVARYGESTGPSRNIPYPHAWRYRDYVLDAFNRDVPFDRFIQEQIAGDLLPASSTDERDRLLTATGFLALGVKDVNQRFKVRFIMDNVDEQIDAVTRSVLGLTVSCARCHDHKTDPIPTTDYYALAGIFTSTDDCAGVRNKMGGGGLDYYNPEMLVQLATDTMPPPDEAEVKKLKAAADAAKKAWDAIRGTPEGREKLPNGQLKQRAFRLRYDKAQADLAALTDPATRGYAAHGVRDSKTIADTQVRIRGEAERLGPTVPRGFLTTFEVPGTPSINPEQSGRLELAQWLTSSANPLTPRVLANRVWHHLFGRGIVSTVDNFGVSGDTPSHPELLDYLANQLVQNGWSAKQLIREVVLSRTYRLGSSTSPVHLEQDPSNQLVWRHAPRRLSAEEMRDAMLATSGRLQHQSEKKPASSKLRMVEMRDNGVEARTIHESADQGLFRSVYLPLLRGVTPKALEAFDPVTQSLVSGQRDATTVPSQALFMLNSPFVRQQSLALAEQTLANLTRSREDSIKLLFERVLNRPPLTHEVAQAIQYIDEFETNYEDNHIVLASLDTSGSETVSDDSSSVDVVPVVPANPDDVDRTEATLKEDAVQPATATAAAWMSFVQALFASAEFRFVR